MTVASLAGKRLPDMDLPATTGGLVNLARQDGCLVIVVYSFTGRPGHPNPPDWDSIPGAHGSTPQCLSFSALSIEFEKLGVKLFGLSFQDSDWQRDFVQRNHLTFPLLSDASRAFAPQLGLESFKAGDQHYLFRRALVVEQGVVTRDFFPVVAPADAAGDVLKVLRS